MKGTEGNRTMERLVVARHLHTINHRKPPQTVTVGEIAGRYQDTDAIIIENHGRFLPPAPADDADPGPLIVPGAEWATPIHPRDGRKDSHHVGLLGVDFYEQSQLHLQTSDAPAVMAQKVHRADGALVYNHPEYPAINKTHHSARALAYTLPLEEARAFDAIELFNDVGFSGSRPSEVLGWVERTFYDRGVFPAIVAGQDDHGPDPVAPEPTYTMAMVDERSEAGLMEAVRGGHTFVSKSRDAQMDLRIDNQSFWQHGGPLLPGKHSFTASLSGLPSGVVIEVVRRGQVIQRTTAASGSADFSLSLSVPAEPGGPDYVYVRVWSSPRRLHTVSSAVPLVVAGDPGSGAEPGAAERIHPLPLIVLPLIPSF